jgi:diguanylate cyclase (GGDEF)-like protein
MDDPPLHILLLEDDRGDARLVQEHLRDAMQSQFTCTCVSSVAEAIQKLGLTHFDVVLLDLNLPDSQGLDTFSKVQAKAGTTPILILTGLEGQNLAMQAIKAGAQDYIVKRELASSLLARAIRYAMERQRLQIELHSLAVSDSLTGFYNRRGFLMLAKEQLKLVQRSSQGLLLFLCDVDDMKLINDTFGQSRGDQLLIDTSIILRATFRASDIIARLDGDEFAILAVGTLPATSELLRARLQANLNLHNERSNRPYQLSLGVGVAGVAAGEQATMEALISKADQEMDEHKRARRKAHSD